jgi:hypothetical protein
MVTPEDTQTQTDRAAMLIAQASAMSAINEQLKNLVEGSQRTERTLVKLDDISRTVIELKVIAENNKSTFGRLFDRLEKVEAAIEREDVKDAAMQTSIALKADTSTVTVVDSKVDGWINQFKGAAMVASVVMAVVQATLLGGVGYVITHLQSGETQVALIMQRLQQLEQSVHDDRKQP